MGTTIDRDDLAALMKRLDTIDERIGYLVQRQEKTEELVSEMTPIAREAMGYATTKLDALEKQGWFAFGKELGGVAERIVEGFTPEDVQQLGDAVVGILKTVRALTQPRILEIASEASEVLERSEQTEPLGLLGMVRATGDADVQKGMAVMMEVMRHVGRAAQQIKNHRSAADARKEKLAAALGPRRARRASEPAPAPSARAPAAASAGAPARAPRDVAAVIEGVAFSADGHLADPKTWTRELAVKLAAAQGAELDEARWAVVTFARGEFEATGASPNIRRLTQGTNLATKDIYALFPKAPARTIAKIAGIPKPAGCI